MGIFTLPQSIRPKAAAQQSSFGEKPVKTEAELRAAIGEIAARYDATAAVASSSFGGGILIVAPFTVSAPIVIPPECLGTVIRAAARFPIRAGALLPCLFEVQAAYVSIRGLLGFYTGVAGQNMQAFVKLTSPTKVGVQSVTIEDNIAYCDQLVVDATSPGGVGPAAAGLAIDLTVRRNVQPAVFAGGVTSIELDSDRAHVTDNRTRQAAAIVLGAHGGEAVISGNNLGGGIVDTSSGTGHSTIVGNTRLGAGSAFAATDVSGLNA